MEVEKRIFSVIVTYNPDLPNVKKLLGSLISSDVFPVIVDNSSLNSFQSISDETYKVISLYQNTGIAHAQNIGIDYCRSQNAQIIIFFDQDSTIPDAFFLNKLFDPIAKFGEKITAPIYTDNNKGFTYPIVSINKSGTRTKNYPKPDDDNFYTNIVISSGTAVLCDVFDSVGIMNDALFIDYVDTEWCLRCHQKSISILVIPSAVMSHSIGDNTINLFLLKVPVHSASRRYYRIRNSIFLFHFPHVPKLLAIREVCFSIIHQMIILACKEDRAKHIKALFRGLLHGFTRFKKDKN